MPLLVLKRNNTVQEWDSNKVINAISLAKTRSKESIGSLNEIADLSFKQLSSLEIVPVDQIHTTVENLLMKFGYYPTAREYITYRQSHMPNIFRKRQNYRPYEYPQFIEYIDAIHQSFWTHKSFNLDSSVQDILVNMDKASSTAVIRSILSIASVEAKVKSFWSNLGTMFPKSEFEEMGATIGANEVYHAHFYAKVLEQLNLNDLFKEVLTTSAMRARINYLTTSLSNSNESEETYIKALIFFSLFIENVSLFTQFLTISVFNKEQNQIQGLAQGISATALEENLHAQAGADIIQIIRKERPNFFTKELETEINQMIKTAIKAELKIIDWIFEEGELPFLPKEVVIEYLYMRTNKGLTMAGFKPLFNNLDDSLLAQSEWFEVQTKTTIHRDFFTGHNTNYTKNSMSFSADSLF
jgi:ribonucleoside-diphosphate reductase beta chain